MRPRARSGTVVEVAVALAKFGRGRTVRVIISFSVSWNMAAVQSE